MAVASMDNPNNAQEAMPEDVRAALAAAGAWRDLDPEEIKRYIYEGRQRGSRPASRTTNASSDPQ